jgi:2-methylcitrate dehydratase PrpD
MEKITHRLAKFAVELEYEDIPYNVIKKTKEQLASILGATLAGADTEPGKKALLEVKAWGDKPEAVAIGGDFRSSMRSAAFVNSISAQLLEFEDALMPYSHIGAASVPAALAVGEAMKRSGKDLIVALVVGNEIGGRVGHAIHRGVRMGNAIPVYQAVVPFVASRLLGHDLTTTLDAVGGALTQIQITLLSGWVSHSKAYLSAMPTLAGVTAACMAKSGFTGYHEALEDPLGYFTQTCERPVPEEAVEKLGEVWQTEKLVNKAFPVCGWTLAPVEGTIDLVKEYDIGHEEIAEINIKVPVQSVMGGTMWKAEETLRNIQERHDWCYIPLLFEMTYPVAAAAVDRELTPRQWRDDRLFDPSIHEMMKRVKYEPDVGLTTTYVNEDKLGALVTVSTRDGRKRQKYISAARGSTENPIDVEGKFMGCAMDIIGRERAQKAWEIIQDLEEVENIGALSDCLLRG